MIELRRPALAACVCLAVCGCYLSHERSGDAGIVDSGADSRRDGSDIGPPPPPPPPPPPRCALAPVTERLIASHPDGSMHAPDLFLAEDRIGVLMFQNDAIGHPVVVLGHVDLALEDVSGSRRVGEESHSWGEAAWTGEAVGVCWDGDPGGFGALRFREIDGLDGELGPRVDFDLPNGPCTELLFAHGVYAMSWRYEHFDEDPARVETTFALMDRGGSLVAEPLMLSSAPYPGRTPAIMATEDGFLVLVGAGEAVRMVSIDPRGAIVGDRALELDNTSYTAAALRDDRVGLLSLEGVPDTRTLVFRIVTLEGELVRERRIEGGAPTVAYPRIEARPEGWALVWAEGFRPSARAVILSLDPRGVPLAARRTLHEGPHSGYGGPSLLSIDDRLYVGISHAGPEVPTGREGTYVERWDCDAPADDLCDEQLAQAGDCEGDHVWGFRWTGDRCAPVVGCGSDCVGEDCDHLATTQIGCESDREHCSSIACPPVDASLARLCAPAELPSSTSRPIEVEIWTDGCPCAPRPRCRIETTGERELTLSFEQCADPVDECECDPEPTRRPVTCVLPPLAHGEWTLLGPGFDPISLSATPPWEMPTEGVVCAVE